MVGFAPLGIYRHRNEQYKIYLIYSPPRVTQIYLFLIFDDFVSLKSFNDRKKYGIIIEETNLYLKNWKAGQTERT